MAEDLFKKGALKGDSQSAEKPTIKPKEITIRLNTKHLIYTGHIILVLALATIIVLQHYEVIPTRSDLVKDSEVVGPIEEVPEEEEEVVEETPPAVEEVVVEEEEEEVVEEEPEEDLLPITGEVTFTIDKLNLDPKPAIEDYAKIASVTFTIINQDVDFTPTIEGYLLMYGEDDVKAIELDELEAGHQITKTSTKLTFGFTGVDEQKTLKLELYNEKNKLLKTVTKTFTSSD